MTISMNPLLIRTLFLLVLLALMLGGAWAVAAWQQYRARRARRTDAPRPAPEQRHA
jgi:hypothetical protein